MFDEKIARWESGRGAYWVELFRCAEDATNPHIPGTKRAFRYTARGAGGVLYHWSDAGAINDIEARLDTFQPDYNTTPMKRVE